MLAPLAARKQLLKLSRDQRERCLGTSNCYTNLRDTTLATSQELPCSIAKCDLLEAYLTDFSVLHSDSLLCSTWAQVPNESVRKGRQLSAADAWIAATAASG